MGVKTVALVSCSGPKLDQRAPAGLIYTSDLFKKSAAYVRSLGLADDWGILSAKHGLLFPDEVIRPYDQTLSRMSAGERKKWVRKVQRQLREAFPRGTHFVVLAGSHYVKALEGLDGYSYDLPLKGMQIGERLKFLKKAVR